MKSLMWLLFNVNLSQIMFYKAIAVLLTFYWSALHIRAPAAMVDNGPSLVTPLSLQSNMD